MIKGEGISVSLLAPLSNAVTEILWSVFDYESGFCVDVHEFVHRDTIMKVANKMQLYRLIYYS